MTGYVPPQGPQAPYGAPVPGGQSPYGQVPYPSQPLPPLGQGAPYGQQPPYAPYGQPSPYGPQGFPSQPPKKEKRKKKRGFLYWVSWVVFVAALAALGYILFTYWQGQQAYDEVVEAADVQVEGDDLLTFHVDWDALRAINPEVVAWIYVPDTPINYPVVHRASGGQTYYLTHNFRDEVSTPFGAEYGCPALSDANSPDFTDDINVISGHNLLNGTMFSAFSSFNDQAFFNEHRIIYLLTPDGNYRLKTFSLDYISGSSTIPIRFASKDQMTSYLQGCIDDSIVVADPPPPGASTMQRAFAFYTCDNSNDVYRYFVFSYVDEYASFGTEGIRQDIAPSSDAAAVNDAVQERTQ